VRQGRIETGSGCAGYVVQLRFVAVFDAGLAGEDGGLPEILSDDSADYRLRHFVFLGGTDGHAGDSFYGPSSLSHGVPALTGTHGGRGEDVEVEGDGAGPRGAQ